MWQFRHSALVFSLIAAVIVSSVALVRSADPSPPQRRVTPPARPAPQARARPRRNPPRDPPRPPGTRDTHDCPRDSMFLYWHAGFRGRDPHVVGHVTGFEAGIPHDFEDRGFLRNIKDDMSSLKWNLPPGVVVVFYQHAGGRGQRIAIWGRGQKRSLGDWGFNDKVSRWAWYSTGAGSGLPNTGS
jgi:hypothetical protein